MSGCDIEKLTVGDGLLVLAALVSHKDDLLVYGNWASIGTGVDAVIASVASQFGITGPHNTALLVKEFINRVSSQNSSLREGDKGRRSHHLRNASLCQHQVLHLDAVWIRTSVPFQETEQSHAD